MPSARPDPATMIARIAKPDLATSQRRRGTPARSHRRRPARGRSSRRSTTRRHHERTRERDHERQSDAPSRRTGRTASRAGTGRARPFPRVSTYVCRMPSLNAPRHPTSRRRGVRVEGGVQCWNDAAHDRAPAVVHDLAAGAPTSLEPFPRRIPSTRCLTDAAAGFPESVALAFLGKHVSYRGSRSRSSGSRRCSPAWG